MSATGPVRLIPIDKRIVLTKLLEAKPALRPFVAAVQAAANEYFGPLGIIAYAAVRGIPIGDALTQYDQQSKPKLSQALNVLGVSVSIVPTGSTSGVSVQWTVTKGPNSVSGSYLIKGTDKDFSDEYLESLSVAAARWARYVGQLTSAEADAILKAAADGYKTFMTSGTPSDKQVMASIKHKIRMDAVDRTKYLQALQAAVQNYQAGYNQKSWKFKDLTKYVFDAIVGAFEFVTDVAKVY